MIHEKIIDTHMHIETWRNEEGSFIDCFEGHREQSGLRSLNICAIPTKERVVCNNIMVALYKLAHPNTYIHGSVDHIHSPMTEDMPEGMDLVTQYRELMAIGFDGIKMLEGKPIYHKTIGGDLNHPSLLRLYAEMEKDGTHIVFHINDPVEFWDRNKVPADLVEKGWFYGDGTYATHEELYEQAEKVFAAYPKLCITLAHLYFCGETPEKLVALFEKYPNLCVDLTPGCEMYHSFEAHHDYYRDFFAKYSDRVMLGTDGTFPWLTHTHVWCMDVLYRFIATTDARMAFDDAILTGIALTGEAKENILYRNFERRVGESPKAIHRDALRAYYEKYKWLLSEEAVTELAPYIEKYL